MSSKIGTIISFLFAALFLLFASDMISLQFIYSELDAKSVSISYNISRNGGLDNKLISYINATYNVDLNILSDLNPNFGDTVTYIISADFDPLILSRDVMKISIKRQTVIGFTG